MRYSKFTFMMTIPYIIIYAVVFLNVEDREYVYVCLSKLYMTLPMTSPMALLVVVCKLYPNKIINLLAKLGSMMIFSAAPYYVANPKNTQ